MAVQPQPAFSVKAPVYVNVEIGDSIDVEMGIHPLRMHPPSSEFRSPYQEQDIALQPQTPDTTSPFNPLSPVNDANFEERPDTSSSSQSQRPVVTEPDIDIANRSIDTAIDEQTRTEPSRSTLETKIVSRDVGYVQAMRLWFEMKEEAALNNQTHQRKTADVVQAAKERIKGNAGEEF